MLRINGMKWIKGIGINDKEKEKTRLDAERTMIGGREKQRWRGRYREANAIFSWGDKFSARGDSWTTREDKGDDEEEEQVGRARWRKDERRREEGAEEGGFEGGGDSPWREQGRWWGGGRTWSLPIADEIRSLLPLACTAGWGPSSPLRRSHDLEARCWYSKTLSGDERHYPHRGW